MSSNHDPSNTRGPESRPRSANHLPDPAYDQLILFAKNYSIRTNAAPNPDRSEGEKAAEFVQIIFRMTKGDVRVRLGALADKLGVTRRRLSTSFQRLYGSHPKEYQLNIRIEWVCNAISHDPSRKIESIAAEVGYTDLADFNHIFRKRVGASPQAYQMRAKAESKNDTF